MRTNSVSNRTLTLILISAVVSLVVALVASLIFLSLLTHPLREQLFILSMVWGVASIVLYALITRLSLRLNISPVETDTGTGLRIRKIFLAVFFLFPSALILYQQVVEFSSILTTGQTSDVIGWLTPGTGTRTFLILTLAVSGLLLVTLFVMSVTLRFRKYFDSLPDSYYYLLIFVITLAIRLPLVYLIDTQPYSDFANIDNDAILLARGEAPINLYATTHVAVTLIYGFLYRLFGVDLAIIKIFHIAVYGLAGLFAYLAGKEMFGSKLWALTAALLLVCWPSLAFYSNVSTPEHLFILVECALIFLVGVFFKNQRKNEEANMQRLRQDWIWFAGIGLLIGISGLFRPFGELFLAAFLLTYLIYLKKRNLKELAIRLFCLFVPFWLVGNLPTAAITYYQGEPPKNVRPCNLLVGMNFQAAGQYNSADRELCTRLRDEAGDETTFTKRVAGYVWERLRTQKDGLIQFVDSKFAILWANSSGILFWALGHVSGGDPNAIQDLAWKVNLMDFAIMFLVTITCLIGTVIAFFKDVKPAIFFCLLSFFGFNLMEIPLELQTRYRTVIMPLMIFFACWTFSTLCSSISDRRLQNKSGLPLNEKRAT
jgi:hypothetical protein